VGFFEISPETKDVLVRFLQPSTILGIAILGSIIILGVLIPLISPYDPYATSDNVLLPPLSSGPAWPYIFGTDSLGRDVFTRVFYAVSTDLAVALITVGLAASIGMVIGLVSGYFGGAFDSVLMRIMDVLISIPGFMLAIAVAAALGASLFNAMLAVAIVTIPIYARLMRGVTLSIKEQLYIMAAKEAGLGSLRIIFKHVLPNALAPLIVQSTLELGNAIIYIAGLSFIGLGAQEPQPEWGLMLNVGRKYLREAWWFATFPGLMIFLVVLSFNLIGDGLRDALDPRLRGTIRIKRSRLWRFLKSET